MAFDDVVRQLDTDHVIAIVTHRHDGDPVATAIWSVVVDGTPYLRSAFGDGSWWYRRARSGRPVAIAIGDGAVEEAERGAALRLPSERVRVEDVPTDDPVHARIDETLWAKYSTEPQNVEPMVSEAATACTLRVLPE